VKNKPRDTKRKNKNQEKKFMRTPLSLCQSILTSDYCAAVLTLSEVSITKPNNIVYKDNVGSKETQESSYFSESAATPGRILPSKSSKLAPPPVET